VWGHGFEVKDDCLLASMVRTIDDFRCCFVASRVARLGTVESPLGSRTPIEALMSF
jgi:hypothetical protein